MISSDSDDKKKPQDDPGNKKISTTQEQPMEKKTVDPTRFGDWEKNGRCIDF